MQILDLLGMYFDAVVVIVINFSILFELSLAILCRFCFLETVFSHYLLV